MASVGDLKKPHKRKEQGGTASGSLPSSFPVIDGTLGAISLPSLSCLRVVVNVEVDQEFVPFPSILGSCLQTNVSFPSRRQDHMKTSQKT